MRRALVSIAGVGLRAPMAVPRQSAETHSLRLPKTGAVRAVSCVLKTFYALEAPACRAEGVCGALVALRNVDSRVFVHPGTLLSMTGRLQCVSSAPQILCVRMVVPCEWLRPACTL